MASNLVVGAHWPDSDAHGSLELGAMAWNCGTVVPCIAVKWGP